MAFLPDNKFASMIDLKVGIEINEFLSFGHGETVEKIKSFDDRQHLFMIYIVNFFHIFRDIPESYQ